MAINFKRFKAVSTPQGADLYMHGEIIDDSNKFIMRWLGIEEGYVLPCDIREQLQVFKGRPLNVYINSPGGDVTSGLAIANMLARHDAPVTAYVDGIAASMASIIFLSCQERIMPKNTFLMIHRPSGCFQGNADDFLQAAAVLETVGKGMMTTYKAAAADGVSEEQIAEDMVKETWYTADEAAKMFKITLKDNENGLQMAACIGGMKDIFKHIPSILIPNMGENKPDETAKKAVKAALNKQKCSILSAITNSY